MMVEGRIHDKCPLVFLFLGPSGVGKTELAKQLANYLHEEKDLCFHTHVLVAVQERRGVSIYWTSFLMTAIAVHFLSVHLPYKT